MHVGRPSSQAARTFDALDLEKPKSPLKGRFEELDLATRRPVSAVASRTKEYAQRAHNTALFPSWVKSMPQYGAHKIAAATPGKPNCEKMAKDIEEEVAAVRKGVDYNGLHLVNEFIQFCENNPGLNQYELFQQFQPQSKEEASELHGTTCVGKAWDIVKRLEEKGVEAHVIVETPGPDKPPTHAAVAVPCSDGILLVEVEHDVPFIPIKPGEPINKSYPDLVVNIQLVEVPGNYKSSAPLIVTTETFSKETDKKKNSTRQFLLRPDCDPDMSVMKRWLVSSHTWFYPVSSARREGEKQHSLQVNVAENKITFNIGDKKYRIPMDAFNPETGTIDRSKLKADKGEVLTEEVKEFILGKEGEGGEFFKAFKTPKNLLMNEIFNIVKHREMLKNLREK